MQRCCPALVLSLTPELEAASFSRPVFYSTRAVDPAVRPRLRISYVPSFPFEAKTIALKADG